MGFYDPQEGKYFEADCGHEVYEGESAYVWDGKTLCPDCFRDKINEMSNEELADVFMCERVEVHG